MFGVSSKIVLLVKDSTWFFVYVSFNEKFAEIQKFMIQCLPLVVKHSSNFSELLIQKLNNDRSSFYQVSLENIFVLFFKRLATRGSSSSGLWHADWLLYLRALLGGAMTWRGYHHDNT